MAEILQLSGNVVPQGIEGVISADSITQTDKLKLVLLGLPGSGKSWLLATARKPILVYDFDDRAASIAGKPGVFIKTLRERDPLIPSAWQQLEQDIGVLEYAKSKGTLQIKTVGIDSLSFALNAAQNQLMKDTTNLSRKIRVNGHDYLIPQGFDSWTVAQKMFLGIFNRLFEIGVDVIACAHIKRQKDARSTKDDPVFTGKYTIEPQNMEVLLPTFNERWMMKDNFRVQLKPDYEFNAVTALAVDEIEEPNIEKILQKHATRVAGKR